MRRRAPAGLLVHIGFGVDAGQAIINVQHRVSAFESEPNVLRISIIVSLAVPMEASH